MNSVVGWDERWFFAINGAGSPTLDILFGLVTWGGHGLVLALLILVPMWRWDRSRYRTHAWSMVLSVALGALAVEGIKRAVDRERPAEHFVVARGHSGVRVRAPVTLPVHRSFPSGHAQAAFGAATYVAQVYPSLAVPAMGIACLVGGSRVYLGAHFPLDVLGGALVGVLFSVAGFRCRALWGRSGPGTDPGKGADATGGRA